MVDPAKHFYGTKLWSHWLHHPQDQILIQLAASHSGASAGAYPTYLNVVPDIWQMPMRFVIALMPDVPRPVLIGDLGDSEFADTGRHLCGAVVFHSFLVIVGGVTFTPVLNEPARPNVRSPFVFPR